MDYPKDTDVLEAFECKAMMQQSYKFSQIQHCLKALHASTKVSIRTNERGFMQVQVSCKLWKPEFVVNLLATNEVLPRLLFSF